MGDAGDIAAGMGEVGDDSRADRRAAFPKRHDDRDGVRRLPRCEDGKRTDGDDDVNIRMHQFGGKSRKLIDVVIGGVFRT